MRRALVSNNRNSLSESQFDVFAFDCHQDMLQRASRAKNMSELHLDVCDVLYVQRTYGTKCHLLPRGVALAMHTVTYVRL